MRMHIHYHDSVGEYLQDATTFDLATQLSFRGIYTDQPDHCTLVFEHDRDATYAVLLVMSDPLVASYTLI